MMTHSKTHRRATIAIYGICAAMVVTAALMAKPAPREATARTAHVTEEQREEPPLRQPEVEEVYQNDTKSIPKPHPAVEKRILIAAAYEIETVDRTQPLYRVYKDGYEVKVDTSLQWFIRDLCNEYGFDEGVIYGLCLMESTFKETAKNGSCLGLAQINKAWLKKNAAMEPYRISEDYAKRDLLNPYDNLRSLVELWNFARDTYGIDLSTEQGYKDLLYFHNTGNYKKNVQWAYSDKIIKYAKELEAV